MTASKTPRDPSGKVACIGGGLIGSAWAAQFAAHGYDVQLYDPSATTAEALARALRRVVAIHGVDLQALQDRVTIVASVEEAVSGSVFVQESVPEDLALKQRIFAAIEEIAGDAVIASSTSDYPPALLRQGLRNGQRIIVGHPINPPYATTLVEVVVDTETPAEVTEAAIALYRSAGKMPVKIEGTQTGFVANRLQMAIMREALRLAHDQKATIAQIDAALMHGIGPRFAAVGMFNGFALNVPSHDPSDWLDHIERFDFGAALVHTDPWPTWTTQDRDRIASEWRAHLSAQGISALADRRDRLTAAACAMHSPASAGTVTSHPHFSVDYQEARRKFRAAASAAGAILETHHLPEHTGPDGKPLYMDFAWLGPEDADVVILSLSGTHGAEGFSGSAAQTHWLMTRPDPLPHGTAMLFVHAVNPFGFAYMLRVNENNVDLNRNFVTFGEHLPPNPLYAAVSDMLPNRTGLDEDMVDEWNAALQKSYARFGRWETHNALECGQYENPAGIEFGGQDLQWSSRTLLDTVRRLCGKARHIAYLDWHSMIPIGDGNLIFLNFNEAGGPLYCRTADWWGEDAISAKTVEAQWSSGTSLPHTHRSGLLFWGLERALAPRADVAGAIVEFCCDPDAFIHTSEPDTRTVMWERWLYRNYRDDTAQRALAMRYLREAAAPTRRSYQDKAIAAAMPVYRRIIEGAGRWAAENIASVPGRLIQTDTIS